MKESFVQSDFSVFQNSDGAPLLNFHVYFIFIKLFNILEVYETNSMMTRITTLFIGHRVPCVRNIFGASQQVFQFQYRPVTLLLARLFSFHNSH